MPLRAVIFDFDGTLVDSFEATRLVANQFADEFGYRPATREEAAQFRGWSYREIARYLGVRMHKVPFIAARVRTEMKRSMGEMRPFEGLPQVLRELRGRGLSLGILTSNSASNVREFLAANDMDSFDFVDTASNVWGKATRLRSLLRRRGLAPDEAAYVGDEVRDIEATQALSLQMIAVAWGYTEGSLLQSHGPSAVVHRPEDLLVALR